MARHGLGRWGFTLLAVALLGVGGATASADAAADAALKESVAKIDALVKDAQLHITNAAGDDQLQADVALATKYAEDMSDAKQRLRCIDIIGTVMKGTTHDDVERSALKAFTKLGDSAAGKYVAPLIYQPSFDANPPLLNDAIECAAKIKSDDTVDRLIKIVEKSDVLPLAVTAMRALSQFGTSKRMREKILDSLVGTVEKDCPGRTSKVNPRGVTNLRSGEDSRNRYEALSGEMCTCCNKLTGQNVASPEDWFTLRKQHKGTLGDLFLS
jgi:hypothetical protein